MSRLLAIDPGINSTGWAFWEKPTRSLFPDEYGLVQAPLGGTWHDRALSNAKVIAENLRFGWLGPHLEVFCEFPAFFASSGGVASAATGSVHKLAFQVGVYAQVFASRGSSFTPVGVNEWKGQLPKDVVCRRVEKILGPRAGREFRADTWDAVGIGLWVKGVFK